LGRGLEVAHELVNALLVLGLTEGGQVSIDDRGRGAVMAQVDLELAEVFALLQEMSRIGMTQRMDMGGFFDAAGAQGQTEAALQRGAAHWLGRGASPQAAVAFGWEEPAGMPVGAPELAQPFESALRQGHVAVAVAFAGADVEEHPLRIDVADFQPEGFAQTQTAGVNCGQGHPMVQGGDPGDHLAHFAGREDDGQFELRRSAGEFQLGGPDALEGLLPEELDGAQGLRGSLAGEAPFGLEIDEILTELFGADLIGGALKVLGQVTDAGPVTLLAAGQEWQQGQVLGEAVQDCVWGTFFICIDLQLLLTVCRALVQGEPSAACESLS
jgi:hypothetical protein